MAEESIKIEGKKDDKSVKKEMMNRGAWTAEEDRKLAEVIEIHGPKRWKKIATKAGISSTIYESDPIRLMFSSRWSLIAGRLPGRTDNEIKNYWNSHLSKKISQVEKHREGSRREGSRSKRRRVVEKASTSEEGEGEDSKSNGCEDSKDEFDRDDFFDFSNESPLTLEWVNKFLELDNNLYM
ncbi:hypothetical protein C3L33_00128, partial [Rhododendron williamsianum]